MLKQLQERKVDALESMGNYDLRTLPLFSSLLLYILQFLNKLMKLHFFPVGLGLKVLEISHLLLIIIQKLVGAGTVHREVSIANVLLKIF